MASCVERARGSGVVSSGLQSRLCYCLSLFFLSYTAYGRSSWWPPSPAGDFLGARHPLVPFVLMY